MTRSWSHRAADPRQAREADRYIRCDSVRFMRRAWRASFFLPTAVLLIPIVSVGRPILDDVAPAPASGASIGLVLTGGGAFGAWEVGALRVFFDAWREKYHEDPPIRVVAGTSTGALIAPFVMDGAPGVAEAERWYTGVSQADLIAPKLTTLLPFPLFAFMSSSVYSVGFKRPPRKSERLLYGKLVQAFPDDRIDRLHSRWSEGLRLVVTSLDFCSGKPDEVTNLESDRDKVRMAILASAMAPLALPPVPLRVKGDDRCAGETPHMDGSIFSVAPFSALFDTAAAEPRIPLTHVVLISAFPMFPSTDLNAVQDRVFPETPKFKTISDRMIALLSEAGASSDARLARAAIALRVAGVSGEEVQRVTGLRIAEPPPVLIELRPASRLGWEVLRFRRAEMGKMVERAKAEVREQLARQLPELNRPD